MRPTQMTLPNTSKRVNRLGAAIAAVLTAGVMLPAAAQTQTTNTTPTATCSGADCPQDSGVLFKIGSRSELDPVTTGTSERSGDRALQPDRRVTISAAPRVAPPALPSPDNVNGQTWSVSLPDGGMIWATEDPTLGSTQMSVSGSSYAAFENGHITKPVAFTAYSNYASFIRKAEILVYRANDTDLVSPLATIEVDPAPVMQAEWDGAWADSAHARVGDELIYVLRAYGEGNAVDETFPQRLQLLSPEEVQRGNEIGRRQTERLTGIALNIDQALQQQRIDATYGRSTLRQQNIRVAGSRIRIQGRNVPDGYALTINGDTVPVDLERKFVAEYLEPIGAHAYAVQLKQGSDVIDHALNVNVTGKYWFAVALADLTFSGNDVSGSIEPFRNDPRADEDLLTEGRLAFYLKAKTRGRYLITAQADTREREVRDLFTGFWKADPQDVFRRLDPDSYYPVYGDDSTTYRDVDTMGRLYARVDWDGNQALWGNYNTGLTGTEYAQYNRSLYGAALDWRQRKTNAWGDPQRQLRVFGSDSQTVPGHNEFEGTGGSLYYLHDTDVLRGSERVVIERRDPTTGRVMSTVELARGADYDIDELQGRILLSRPLERITRDGVPSLTTDAPLAGYLQVLMVDYEAVPATGAPKNIGVGLRGKQWFGDHIGVGVTYVDENRSGDDYNLAGVDLTLQAGKGTYLQIEQSRSHASSMDVYRSDNGGLSFDPITSGRPDQKGTARAIEARMNLRELGWTQNDWSAAAWNRNVSSGYSVARYQPGVEVHETGAELMGQVTRAMSLYGRYSKAERGDDALEQGQLTAEWRLNENTSWAAEWRRVTETRQGLSATGDLAALQFKHRAGSQWEYWLTGQKTLSNDDGRYADNDALAAGAKYLFGNLSSIGAEVTTGDRGDAAQVNAEYRLSADHSFYANYTTVTDSTQRDPLFNPQLQDGWTLGQRWRLGNRINVFNESQYLKSPNDTALNHVFGMDFYPSAGWNAGFKLSNGRIDKSNGEVERKAVSVTGGRTSESTQWQSKVEWRRDRGVEQREQWVTTNHLQRKVNDSLRLAARFNWSETTDALDPTAGAKFVEGNFGFAYRPWDNTRYALFGRYTYLYDVSALQQTGERVAYYDQRSQVLSFEGIYHPSPNWEWAGKIARRAGEVRYGRLQGEWADADTTFAAAQVRYGIGQTDWNVLGEYRWLSVRPDGGRRSGALLAVDRDIGRNFRIGLGYNFTDFSDDLTNFDYDHRGWFLNMTGRY